VLTQSLFQPGPVVRTGPSRVDICDIGAVKEIHKTNSRFLKSDWYLKLVPNGSETMFSTTDQQLHSSRRRLLASPISDSSLTRMEPLILSRVHMAINRITEEMGRRGTADVFKWWLFMATDVIGELSFGESFRVLEAGEVTQLHQQYHEE
jgi:cytochrome P450